MFTSLSTSALGNVQSVDPGNLAQYGVADGFASTGGLVSGSLILDGDSGVPILYALDISQRLVNNMICADVIGDINSRRGRVNGMEDRYGMKVVSCEVPLAEMFGYATVLRSATQGKAEFTMEFARYAPAPREVAEELVKEWQEKRAAGK